MVSSYTSVKFKEVEVVVVRGLRRPGVANLFFLLQNLPPSFFPEVCALDVCGFLLVSALRISWDPPKKRGLDLYSRVLGSPNH